MHPELRFAVGQTHVVVSTHALAILIAVASGALAAVRRARQPEAVLLAVTAVAVLSLGGSHLLFRLLHGGGDGGFWTGGLASTGGIVAGLCATVVSAWLTGRPFRELLDAIAPAGLLALGVGRLGCFLAGCCYGAPTDLPWGISMGGPGLLARHPLQLYSAIGDLLLVGLLPRHAPTGIAGCRACLGFGLLRAGLETLRDPATTDVLVAPVTLPQAAAIVLAIAGVLGERRLRAREPSIMPPTQLWKLQEQPPPEFPPRAR